MIPKGLTERPISVNVYVYFHYSGESGTLAAHAGTTHHVEVLRTLAASSPSQFSWNRCASVLGPKRGADDPSGIEQLLNSAKWLLLIAC